MKKIEIVDCCNINHKISMMISDSRMDFSDDVYISLEKQKGLSDKQIQKLNNFRKSCPGPIMVDGLYFSDNDSEYLGSKNFAWTCFNFYKANGFVFVYYYTMVEGDREFVFKYALENYKGMESAREDFHRWRTIGQSSFDIVWYGPKIY